MDTMFCCLIVLICILTFSKSLFLRLHSTKKKKNLPPSPPSLPILGHLHLLRQPLCRSLSHISQLHGPVLLLRFGSQPVLLVSSPSAVQECFTTNDIAFANRPCLLVTKHLGYDYTSTASASYGPHWRNIRRLFTLELLSTHRVNGFSSIRLEEVRSLVKNLAGDLSCLPRTTFRKVELKSRFFGLVLNIVMRMVAGGRHFNEDVEDDEDDERFRKIVSETFTLSSVIDIGDYFPSLRWMDINGLEKKMVDLNGRRDVYFQRLIDDHRRKNGSNGTGGETKKTFVDVLLSLQDSDPEYYTNYILKSAIMDVLSAGTDTSAITLEWAMSLVLNHPEVLKAAQEEIDAHVHKGQLVEEGDLPHLPYLHAIINETLRLYPPGPLLVPHQSSEDTIVSGFCIPRGTILIANVWAIQRDEKVWEEPTKFKPERFLNAGCAGEGFNHLPFGYGRRRCPGEVQAMRVVGLALAVLIQFFDWERVGAQEVDMTEGPGLTMPKVVPLEALCRTREAMIGVLSQL